MPISEYKPPKVVWYFAQIYDFYKKGRRMWTFIRIKDSRLPVSIDALIDQIKDAAHTLYWKKDYKGKYFIRVVAPHSEKRFQKNLLMVAEVDFTQIEPKVRPVAWNTADLTMRRFNWVWKHSDSTKRERGPNLVGAVPQMVPRDPYTGAFKPAFPATGSIRKQYEPHKMSRGVINPDHVVFQYPSRFPNKYYDRMIRTTAGKKPRLPEPSY